MERTAFERALSTRSAGRRRFLAMAAACAVVPSTSESAQLGGGNGRAALTKEQRDRMTPGEVLEALKKGNERFRSGRTAVVDYRDQKRMSAAGQYPAAVVVGCIDSRAPAEII